MYLKIARVLLIATVGLGIGTAQAGAASLSFTGPATGTSGTAYVATLAVDPANDAGDSAPTLTVRVLEVACPDGPGSSNVPAIVSQSFPTADGAKAVDVKYTPPSSGRKHLCAWLDLNGTSATAYAMAEHVVDVAAAAPFRGNVSVTAAWGRTASGKCRVSGEVTPRGTGKVKLQHRSGTTWKTIKAVSIVGTKYATTFKASKGQRLRISYAGSTTLRPGASPTHRVTKRSKFEC